MSDKRLSELVNEIEKIKHIKRLRIHTRLPIVLPERVTPTLRRLLNNTRLTTVIVFHINHAQEIDESVALICQQLQQTGSQLLNQAVLLADVNDSVTSLCELSEKLSECGVLPYYLHQLDRVSGAAHFEVSDQHAKQLLDQLNARLPGYLVPKLVREIAGESSKSAL